MQYSQDFGIITKESLKRITNGQPSILLMKNPILRPRTSTEFANVNFMRPLPSEEINPETESAIKEFVERYRPLRQRTVREEPTKG